LPAQPHAKNKDEITQLVSDAVKQNVPPTPLRSYWWSMPDIQRTRRRYEATRLCAHERGAKKAFEELQAQGIKDTTTLHEKSWDCTRMLG
ncbi:MAG: hypothetical protein OSJ51_11900, partial [Parabacteroides distasonis]|nr:hypothetical protein [Parabacteroides distasonis]